MNIVNIKIPMTVERKCSSSYSWWRMQCRGLGTMTQTYTISNLKPDDSLHHCKAFPSTSSLNIGQNYLEHIVSADEFTCKQACLLEHNFPSCPKPCVFGKVLAQICSDRSRNTASFLWVFIILAQCVRVFVCLGSCRKEGQHQEAPRLLGLNPGCPSWLDWI